MIMDEYMELRPVKYTEHKTVIKKYTKKLPVENKKKISTGRDSARLVRVCVMDRDATDSSSDDEEFLFPRRRVKRLINEIRVEPSSSSGKTLTVVDPTLQKVSVSGVEQNPRKFRGVRRRPWGKYARRRSDQASWPDALTNFTVPTEPEPEPVSNISVSLTSESMDDSHHLLSPTSVLNYQISELTDEPIKPVKQEFPEREPISWSVGEDVSSNTDDSFPLDIPFLDKYFNESLPDISIFDQSMSTIESSDKDFFNGLMFFDDNIGVENYYPDIKEIGSVLNDLDESLISDLLAV
ncbi:hypothetical protein HID58_031341 [Brassica napus]|uniref:AP2/ERF domain-containing protein n=1 Tax=Brassica napus TaxID=3708 RepID=A0ABQ7XI36_BRANA|nr:hypothetical protein HID58_031341 [Brassica napus]